MRQTAGPPVSLSSRIAREKSMVKAHSKCAKQNAPGASSPRLRSPGRLLVPVNTRG